MEWNLPWNWFWVILSAILVVGEIFTAGFFILPFGIGAAVAAVFAWLGFSLVWQWAVFLVVSVGLLLPLKQFADRISESASDIGVASDRVIGKIIRGLEYSLRHRLYPANQQFGWDFVEVDSSFRSGVETLLGDVLLVVPHLVAFIYLFRHLLLTVARLLRDFLPAPWLMVRWPPRAQRRETTAPPGFLGVFSFSQTSLLLQLPYVLTKESLIPAPWTFSHQGIVAAAPT